MELPYLGNPTTKWEGRGGVFSLEILPSMGLVFRLRALGPARQMSQLSSRGVPASQPASQPARPNRQNISPNQLLN